MSRWKVAQHVQHRFWLAYPAIYDAEEPESNVDDDLPRQPLARGFRKWHDAIAYADRMARTVEVVLPRNHDLKKSVHKDINGDLYANYSSANYWAQDNWNKGPKPLALALLALAEQEEHA